jgi:hypothetical protein
MPAADNRSTHKQAPHAMATSAILKTINVGKSAKKIRNRFMECSAKHMHHTLNVTMLISAAAS